MQNLTATYRLYQLIKILALFVPIALANLSFFLFWEGVNFDYLFMLCRSSTLKNVSKQIKNRLARVVIYHKDFLPIKSTDPLITLSCELT